MVHFQLRAGIWTNAEDEILKVAVMKYGLNSWGRVASFFRGKTAQQCKTRWHEYLKPTIRKTEWTQDEDEKLLQLVKMLRQQWRSIASNMNRTAVQCIERYTYLSQLALGKAPEEVASTTSKFEANIQAEHKPARPDAVDQDEAEAEMIQTASARTANTRGKKATRRLRERQQQTAREMATLQRAREMKAAGVAVRTKNTENYDLLNISKFRPPTDTNEVFDTTQERLREKQTQNLSAFVGKRVQDIQGEAKDAKLERIKQKAYQAEKELKETNLPAYILQTGKINVDLLNQPRAKLELSSVTTKDPSTTTTTTTPTAQLLQHQHQQPIDKHTQVLLQVADLDRQSKESTPLADLYADDGSILDQSRVKRPRYDDGTKREDSTMDDKATHQHQLVELMPQQTVTAPKKAPNLSLLPPVLPTSGGLGDPIYPSLPPPQQGEKDGDDDLTKISDTIIKHLIAQEDLFPYSSDDITQAYTLATSHITFDPVLRKFASLPPGHPHKPNALRQEALLAQGWLKQQTRQTDKVYKQATITMGGYEKRLKAVAKDIHERFTIYQSTLRELEGFSHLMENEKQAIHHRLDHWARWVTSANTVHQEYQRKYADLQLCSDGSSQNSEQPSPLVDQ